MSQRYPVERDHNGQENNVFKPNDIRLSKNERKKPKNNYNPYNIKRILSDLRSEKNFALSEKGGYVKTVHSMHDQLGSKSIAPSDTMINRKKSKQQLQQNNPAGEVFNMSNAMGDMGQIRQNEFGFQQQLTPYVGQTENQTANHLLTSKDIEPITTTFKTSGAGTSTAGSRSIFEPNQDQI